MSVTRLTEFSRDAYLVPSLMFLEQSVLSQENLLT